MASIDSTPRKKICFFTHFFTPKLNFSACSKKTSRFSLNRLDYEMLTGLIAPRLRLGFSSATLRLRLDYALPKPRLCLWFHLL